jgi:hypothetical protein
MTKTMTLALMLATRKPIIATKLPEDQKFLKVHKFHSDFLSLGSGVKFFWDGNAMKKFDESGKVELEFDSDEQKWADNFAARAQARARPSPYASRGHTAGRPSSPEPRAHAPAAQFSRHPPRPAEARPTPLEARYLFKLNGDVYQYNQDGVAIKLEGEAKQAAMAKKRY